ncbi:MAG: hypothetical protein HOV87_36075 [Catenulispora sp.]|nr:hypothetical protein [Catenulispora sp.]
MEHRKRDQIAGRLFIGVDTVKKHLTRVPAATSCASRTQLAVLFNARDTVGQTVE